MAPLPAGAMSPAREQLQAEIDLMRHSLGASAEFRRLIDSMFKDEALKTNHRLHKHYAHFRMADFKSKAYRLAFKEYLSSIGGFDSRQLIDCQDSSCLLCNEHRSTVKLQPQPLAPIVSTIRKPTPTSTEIPLHANPFTGNVKKGSFIRLDQLGNGEQNKLRICGNMISFGPKSTELQISEPQIAAFLQKNEKSGVNFALESIDSNNNQAGIPNSPLPPSFKCTVSDCQAVFKSRLAVNEHLASHPLFYKCPSCTEIFSEKSNAIAHYSEHSNLLLIEKKAPR